MFCPQCGKPVLDGARFCNPCGAALAVGPPGSDTAGSAGPQPWAAGGAGSAGASGSSAPASGPVARVRNILFSPSTEWRAIAAETASTRTLYLGYVAPLVAIGVVATFVGETVVGLSFVGRFGLGAALVHAVVAYALSFAGVFFIALIVDLLAPSFGGQRDALAALKVTAYSFTPGWIAGIFHLIPALGVLAIVGALYGLYLLYLGLPALMRCPEDKSVGYTIVTVVCAIVTWVVIAALTTCVIGGLGLAGVGALGRLGAHADRNSTADTAVVLTGLVPAER